MTQRVRALLDEAVAGVAPRDPDPLAAVVARSRAGRRQAVGAAVAVVAVLVATGVGVAAGAGPRAAQGPAQAPESSVAMPPAPAPEVVGDTVVVGTVVIPVPAGWRVVKAVAGAPCEDLKDTVLIGLPDPGSCQTAPIEVLGMRVVTVSGRLARSPLDNLDPLIEAPATYTLPGGEPAWLTTRVDDEVNTSTDPPGKVYLNELIMPWSKVMVALRVPGPRQRQIIESIRSSATHPAAGLRTAPAVDRAVLAIPDRSGTFGPTGPGIARDPAKVTAVLDLLKAQQPVDGADACADPGQLTARLDLHRPALAPVEQVQPPADEPTSWPGEQPTTIVISLGGRCQEAVSSEGGRVRLGDAALAELQRLLGLTPR